MAAKTLNARGCYADMVDRMWAYMDAGDTENADCVRQKALILLGLIKTADRWKPTILEGGQLTYVVTITSGNFTFPYLLYGVQVNGMNIMSPVTIYSGDNYDVYSAAANAINSFLSSNDDTVQVSAAASSAGAVSVTITVKYINSLAPIVFSSAYFVGVGTTVSVEISAEVLISQTPTCLTDEQILSVIGKIDELCDCNC